MTHVSQKLVFATVVFPEGFFDPLLLRYVNTAPHVAGEIPCRSKLREGLVQYPSIFSVMTSYPVRSCKRHAGIERAVVGVGARDPIVSMNVFDPTVSPCLLHPRSDKIQP